MSKKIKIGLGIIILVIVVFMLSKMFSGSNSNSTGSLLSPSSIGDIKDPQNKAILSRYRIPTESDRKPETSIDKLDQAWQDGKIKLEDYVVLQFRALYGGNKLPTIYQGETDNEKDQAYIYALAVENFSSFSKETQEAILPFILPPSGPESYFYPINTAKQNNDFLQKIFDIKTVNATGGDVFKLVTAMDKVTIAYPLAKESELRNRAEWVAQAARDSIPKYESMFFITHQQIDINLVSSDVMSSYGSAGPNPYNQNFCGVKIRDNMDEKTTKSTTAHEIFHCFQFKLGLKYIKPDMKWLMEATATWAEDFVYHGYASEHEYDQDYFSNTNDDLFSLRDNREYALYLWFYYLYQKSGFLPSDIAGMLIASKTSEPRNILQGRPNFNYDFKDFAVWNWNQDIAKRYIDDPKFPEEAAPTIFSLSSRDVKNIGEDNNTIELNKGGILYNYYTFLNEDIKNIEFNTKDFIGNNEDRKGLQALYKVNGNWYQEDWSGLDKKTFCRSIEDENVELVVVIASNSNVKDKTSGQLKVKTDDKCSPGWRGTITVNWENSNSNQFALSSRTITGNYSERGQYTLHETLSYDPEDDNLNVEEQEYSALYETAQGVHGGNKECGLMWNQSSKFMTGSGYEDYRKKKNDPPSRMVGNNDQIEENHKFQGQYELSFDIFYPVKKDEYKFKGRDTRRQLNLPCSLIGIPEPNGLEEEIYPIETNEFAYEPNWVKIEVKPKDKIIAGENKFEIHSGVFGTVRWNFQRVD